MGQRCTRKQPPCINEIVGVYGDLPQDGRPQQDKKSCNESLQSLCTKFGMYHVLHILTSNTFYYKDCDTFLVPEHHFVMTMIYDNAYELEPLVKALDGGEYDEIIDNLSIRLSPDVLGKTLYCVPRFAVFNVSRATIRTETDNATRMENLCKKSPSPFSWLCGLCRRARATGAHSLGRVLQSRTECVTGTVLISNTSGGSMLMFPQYGEPYEQRYVPVHRALMERALHIVFDKMENDILWTWDTFIEETSTLATRCVLE